MHEETRQKGTMNVITLSYCPQNVFPNSLSMRKKCRTMRPYSVNSDSKMQDFMLAFVKQ